MLEEENMNLLICVSLVILLVIINLLIGGIVFLKNFVKKQENRLIKKEDICN